MATARDVVDMRARDRKHRHLYDQGVKRAHHLALAEHGYRSGPAPAIPEDMSMEEGQIFSSGIEEGTRTGLREVRRRRLVRPKRVARKVTRGVARSTGAAGVATQIWHLILIGLGLVVLYLVLTSAKAVSGVLGGLTKTVSWITSPTKGL